MDGEKSGNERSRTEGTEEANGLEGPFRLPGTSHLPTFWPSDLLTLFAPSQRGADGSALLLENRIADVLASPPDRNHVSH